MIFAISIVSCKKSDVLPDPPANKATTDMVVSSSFDWKTTKEITLNVIGMKGVNPNVKNTLQIKSSNGDVIYYNDVIFMSSNYVLNFAVPSTETKVIIIYGTKNQIIDLVSNSINFDYITQ